jgi:SAM-dependent methyltransferase
VDEFHFRHVSGLREGTLVLDLGGNRLGKRGRFDIEMYGLEVVYANLSGTKRPHVRSEAEFLPFKDGVFDAVVCSELLEHVPDPISVLREILRVLRQAGTVLLCVPFMNRIHGDPNDYGRYTDYYWLENLKKIGFDTVQVEQQGGFWSVFVEMARYLLYLRTRAWGPKREWMLRIIGSGVALCKRTAIEWDNRPVSNKNVSPTGFTTGFGIRARKP